MILLQQTVDAAERAESQDEPALDRYALPDLSSVPRRTER
jgi:hypothetical protein